MATPSGTTLRTGIVNAAAAMSQTSRRVRRSGHARRENLCHAVANAVLPVLLAIIHSALSLVAICVTTVYK